MKLFSPYDRLKEPQPEGRAAAGKFIRATQADGQPKRVFIYVNNRFEGNAPGVIAAILEEIRE